MADRTSFFAELQRRHVYKVGAMYAVGGWLLVQVATQVFPFFEISNAAVKWTVIVIAAGFPVAIILAWLFDITPAGIIRTESLQVQDETPGAARERHGVDRKLNWVLGAMLVLAVGYVILDHTLLPGRSTAPTTGVALDKSIAVLPFENLSGDPDNAYFASGIQDEILTRLAGIADLKVISRTSTEKYKSKPDNLKTVGVELVVGVVLEGSVQKSGGKVRVNVQLIDARADQHLWANTYDRDLSDVFAVESEVSQDIADALKAKLSPSEASALASLPTRNAEAYDLFLRAEGERFLANEIVVEDSFRRAEATYRQAIALDPTFGLALARLALCQMQRLWLVHRTVFEPADFDDIKQTVERALASAPNQAEAYISLGYLHYWGAADYAPAVTAFQRALALQPSNVAGFSALAYIDRRQDRWQQALSNLEKATSLAPRDSVYLGEYGLTLQFLRRYDDAAKVMRRALAVDPLDRRASTFLFLNTLLGKGETASARDLLQSPAFKDKGLYPLLEGSIINLAGYRYYPEVFERRFVEAAERTTLDATDSADQRVEKLAARVAIDILSGHRDAKSASCTQLNHLLEPKLADHPDETLLLTRLTWTYVCLDRAADAIRIAQHAVDLLPMEKDAYFGTHRLNGLAEVYAQTGHIDEAIKIIMRLMSIPAGSLASVARLKLDPIWDPLRSDPRFQKIIDDGEAAARP